MFKLPCKVQYKPIFLVINDCLSDCLSDCFGGCLNIYHYFNDLIEDQNEYTNYNNDIVIKTQPFYDSHDTQTIIQFDEQMKPILTTQKTQTINFKKETCEIGTNTSDVNSEVKDDLSKKLDTLLFDFDIIDY